MLASVLISAVSVVLLVYWFRYTCLLLLRRESVESWGSPDNRFGVLDVRERLATEADLDPLHRSLERDYRILTYLLRHATQLGNQSVEERMLILDYKLMQMWYSLTRSAAPEQARCALSEMAAVIVCLSQKMGEQANPQPEV